jgi:hypothetical protein
MNDCYIAQAPYTSSFATSKRGMLLGHKTVHLALPTTARHGPWLK